MSYRRRRFPRCKVCGEPVTCGQGDRHLSCSPLCKVDGCWEPIPSTGHKCNVKKANEHA
ncbi:Uncharacterised protein [Mycobacteroides abscessus subsp. abscessus]|nr:hypothetical protein PROPHIGD58-1_30 [Mycobacterium phage prophi58-1]QSM04082.1 hypothetical protein PROPHIGD03_1_30 [Mycobacterium phage prophiGD03-1]SHQ93760.1 Uncharacterised protein [Mycobacteroides abscessus subsp. abscessus]SIC96071.1 Uncharacterised protein [Mycobacteroides abscessus subsp. bolletii]SHT22528.1 Uncharacterised protein [Mycobacteroides abscessus subsp. abscessus]